MFSNASFASNRLLAQLCEDFTATESSKLKRLQRLQTQMDEIMDTMRVTVSLNDSPERTSSKS